MRRVAIISTGTELVTGRVNDTNACFLGGRLFAAGFRVVMHITVGDDPEALADAVGAGRDRADIVIITGGLGATDDDYTTRVLARLFDRALMIDPEGQKRMESFFASFNRAIIDRDYAMVTVPADAHLFENRAGLATGYAISHNDMIVIAMPGVPREMSAMFEGQVLPYLVERYHPRPQTVCTLRTVMVRETEANELVRSLRLPFDRIEWGITTVTGINTISVTAREPQALDSVAIRREAAAVFGDRLLMPEHHTVESETLALLREQGMSIAVAESCTGGLVAKKLTDLPGASAAFLGGIVAYDNQAKIDFLDVPAGMLAQFGAVSEETARAMAVGARDRFRTTIGIATTGIAGPDGGTPEKPVGTVCFALASPEGVLSWRELIPYPSREQIREYATVYILNRLRLWLRRLIQ